MKCPDCGDELVNVPIAFAKHCNACKITWIIQTVDQSVKMGILNTALLGRTDLTQEEKIQLILEKAEELERKN